MINYSSKFLPDIDQNRCLQTINYSSHVSGYETHLILNNNTAIIFRIEIIEITISIYNPKHFQMPKILNQTQRSISLYF